MKKRVLFLCAIICLSCSTEKIDEEENQSQDPIIGSWSPYKMTEYPTNADIIVTEYDECQQKSTITFDVNGDYETIAYSLNSEGNCTQRNYENVVSETWERISDGIYRLSSKHRQTSGEITQSNSTPDKISFPDSKTMNIMIRGSNRYDSDPIKVEYYITTFKRN